MRGGTVVCVCHMQTCPETDDCAQLDYLAQVTQPFARPFWGEGGVVCICPPNVCVCVKHVPVFGVWLMCVCVLP